MNQNVSESAFAETWNLNLENAVKMPNSLLKLLRKSNASDESSPFGAQMSLTGQLLRQRKELKTSKNGFYLNIGGNAFDTHYDLNGALSRFLKEIDNGLRRLVTELKSEGVWDNVVFVLASEFGRTLEARDIGGNGDFSGTDHGWGGNYFIAGGAVKGGQILGKYPRSLAAHEEVNYGYGRLIPTTSWEALWNGICEWFNIDETTRNQILPNRPNFAGQLFSKADLFKK